MIIILDYWLFITQIIMIAWAFRPKALFKKFDWAEGSRLQVYAGKFIGWSAFIGFSLPIYKGYSSSLSFLPSWLSVVDEYGERTPMSSTIGAVMAAIIAAGIMIFLTNTNDKRRENIAKEGRTP